MRGFSGLEKEYYLGNLAVIVAELGLYNLLLPLVGSHTDPALRTGIMGLCFHAGFIDPL
jgi:hypothetical protein